MAPDKPGLRLLDREGEPLGAYLRQTLERWELLGDGSLGLVLPRLGGTTICQVYSGVCIEDEARQVLEQLLAGRRVWCPREGVEELGRGSLGRAVRERLWLLRRSGLVLCPLGQLAQLARQERERGRRYGIWPGDRLGVVYPKGRGDGGI